MSAFAEMDKMDPTHLQNIGSSGAIPLNPESAWPEPDMTVVSPERVPAPVMTSDELQKVFGPWASWLESAAEVKGASVDYVALSLLSTASAVVGNARWAVVWDGWKEPPIIWGMAVGDPSAGKSPALDAVLDPIKTIDDGFAADYRSERQKWVSEDEVAGLVLGQWKSETKLAMTNGETPPEKPDGANAGAPPVRKRVRIVDVTTEKVAELLAASWRGLLLSRDELSGWLGSMDRYNGGGDRPFWLESYGGRTYTVDRKNSPEPISVDHLTVAVMGGTQPDKLASLLTNCADDGLLARFMTVFPDPAPIKKPTVKLDEQMPIEAFKRLHTLSPAIMEDGSKRPFYMHLNEPAQDAFQSFRVRCRKWEDDATGLMKSHMGKMPGMVIRTATVLALLDWAHKQDMPAVEGIDASHIVRACHYVGEHLRGHAYRAYGISSVSPGQKLARRLAHIIKAERLTELNIREVQKRELAGRPDAKAIKAACAVLVEADWLILMPSQRVGRPKGSYAVNPRIGGAP